MLAPMACCTGVVEHIAPMRTVVRGDNKLPVYVNNKVRYKLPLYCQRILLYRHKVSVCSCMPTSLAALPAWVVDARALSCLLLLVAGGHCLFDHAFPNRRCFLLHASAPAARLAWLTVLSCADVRLLQDVMNLIVVNESKLRRDNVLPKLPLITAAVSCIGRLHLI
jgi:hypothetical protein